jgi:aryl-alcohol dehydrogenase-like predicted oxidoreductase
LRQQVELSLRHLGVERIDLLQLHRIDPKTPLAESLGELVKLQKEGKIRHIGLSEVSVEQFEAARKLATIVSVQNLFNLSNRSAEPLLDHVTKLGVAFIPWFPLATGALARPGGPLAKLAEKHRVSASQLALAWLLKRSPIMLPIPGTSTVKHLDENVASAEVTLSAEEVSAIGHAV